jgi:hypothetical protein
MIDEVSMMNYKLLDLLDSRFLRVLMEKDEYMGGKLVEQATKTLLLLQMWLAILWLHLLATHRW